MLTSCSFDQDESFRPESDGILLLSEQRLYRLDREGASVLSEEPVADMTIDEDQQVWFAFSEKQQVTSSDGQEMYSTSPLSPHYIAAGPIHLLVVDTLRNELGFFHRKKRTLVHQEPLDKPGEVAVMVDKFYVLSHDSIVHVFLDQALTETGVITLPSGVSAVRPSAEGYILYTLEGEPLRAARIAYLTEALIEAPFSRRNLSPSQPCNWLDQHFPSSLRAVFGTEWTQPVALCPDSIRSGNVAFGTGAHEIAIDFFNSRAFYRHQDSLFGHNLKTNQAIGAWPWPGGSFDKIVSSLAVE